MTGSVSNTLTNSYCRHACTAPSLPPAVAVTGSVSNTELSHDKIDEIGEAINPGEADWVLAYVSRVLLPERPDQRFPGSQPVSLARANMELVWLHRCREGGGGEEEKASTLVLLPSFKGSGTRADAAHNLHILHKQQLHAAAATCAALPVPHYVLLCSQRRVAHWCAVCTHIGGDYCSADSLHMLFTSLPPLCFCTAQHTAILQVLGDLESRRHALHVCHHPEGVLPH